MKKGIVFVVVWGIITMVALFAIAAVYLMGNQAFLAGHTTRRIEAYYTAKAGMVFALDQLRQGINPPPSPVTENSLNAVINVGAVIAGGPFDGCMPVTVSVTY